MTSNQENEDKLTYAARLSGLLLNEGTDVMRWFLKDNLPRIANEKPDLPKLLREKQKTFEHLRDDPKMREKYYFGHEMFDILFPPKKVDIDEGSMEISLIFTLIRILCKIKHPSWKWWDEDPQAHQKVPVFDVIRLVRFKNKMKNVVHNYKITRESYERSLKYVTNLIDRLRGFKISARRWEGDVIAYEKDEAVTKERKTLDLVTIMRWQTLTVDERDDIYLVMKKNYHQMKEENSGVDWASFIAFFGQMRSFKICDVNELEEGGEERRFLVARANDLLNREYSPSVKSHAMTLTWHLVHDTIWKSSLRGMQKTSSVKSSNKYAGEKQSKLTPLEQRIYSSIDEKVFVTDSPSDSALITSIRESWKEKVIESFSRAYVFPYGENDSIEMDEVTTNLSEQVGSRRQALVAWTDMFRRNNGDRFSPGDPFRIVISGPPCCGKTTLLQKIAYYCATKQCPLLSTYDIVFLVDLSKVKIEKPYARFVDCIKEQCLAHSGVLSSDELEDVFKARNGGGILLLFDNADDFDFCDETYQFLDLMRSDLWPKCAIIRTKREFDRWKNVTSAAKGVWDESAAQWHNFYVDGFRVHDVIKEARRFFGKGREAAMINHASFARHALNLMRVFQRDIYGGQRSSPILTSILCKAFQENFQMRDIEEMPETLGRAVEKIFSGCAVEAREIGQKVLNASLKNHRYVRFASNDGEIENLVKSGLVRDVDDTPMGQKRTIKFVHPLLQDYLSATVYCAGKTEDLRKHIPSAAAALRIGHFLAFCCEIDVTVAEDVFDILGDLVKRAQEIEKDALQLLCLHCFYASQLTKDSQGHCSITSSMRDTAAVEESISDLGPNLDDDDENSDLITATLTLAEPHKLSYRTRQSLLKFVGACRPGRSSSGTVFPLLKQPERPRSTSDIRRLTMSHIRSSQVIFTASIISSLPFLDTISLLNIEAIAAKQFEAICNSLKPATTDQTSPLHSLTISFKCDTRFDMLEIPPSYEALGVVLPHLPFLESLNIKPLSYGQLVSLYDNSTRSVPIQVVRLSRTDLSEHQGLNVANFLRRSPFVNVLDLSHNPLYGGLCTYQETFLQFRTLEVLNVEECCLSLAGAASLATCLTAPRLSCTVTSLNLRCNHINDQMALLSLAKSIGCLKALRRLNLSQNFLRDRALCVLSSQFHSLRDLRELRLDYVQMGELGFSSLRTNLQYLEKLEILSLGENQLAPDALRLISDLADGDAKLLYTLTELKLSGISGEIPLQVTRKGMRKAAYALCQFSALRMLDLTHTSMTYSEVNTLLYAAEDHKALTKLRLSDENVSLSPEERTRWSCLFVE